MAERNTFVDVVNGDQLNQGYFNGARDEVYKGQNGPWHKMFVYSGSIGSGLIKWSATRWQTEAGVTTDSGVTWVAGGYGANYVATTSGTAGISIKQSDGTSTFSTNSGATWGAASTTPANVLTVNAVAMASTTVGVCGGTAGAGVFTWYTADGGDNWTQSAAGTGAEVFAMCMASATVGYLIDTNGDIWKTTDGGNNWVDTTDNTTNNIAYRMYAVSTDQVLFSYGHRPYLTKYVNSTHTQTLLIYTAVGDTNDAISDIVKATNGYYYFVSSLSATTAASNIGISSITAFKYDGTNMYMKPVGMAGLSSLGTTYWKSANGLLPVMIEVSNKLYLNTGSDQILEIDVKEDSG